MIIETFICGPLDTNAYLVACRETKRAVLIDAPYGCVDELLREIEQHHLVPELLLLTHSHGDHIADAPFLKQKLGIPVWIHHEDAPNLESPGADGLPLFFPMKGMKPDGYLVEGQQISVGNLVLQVLHTPGHTPGGVCFYLKSEKTLFSGDTLFQGAIGNLSFPTSRPDLMRGSLRRLTALPKEIRVYPGHGGVTTIGDELEMLMEIIQ